MKLCTVKYNGMNQAAVILGEQLLLVETMNNAFQLELPTTIQQLIQEQRVDVLRQICQNRMLEDLPKLQVTSNVLQAPYRQAAHILGIANNFAHTDEQPIIFMKPASSIIGADEPIQLPTIAKDITASATLAVIINQACHRIEASQAQQYILGYSAAIDVTVQDIYETNAGLLQVAKILPSSLSFGPVIVTADEIADVSQLTVTGLRNGTVMNSSSVATMRYSPATLIAHLSQFVELQAGDMILMDATETFSVQKGDSAACQITDFPALQPPFYRYRFINLDCGSWHLAGRCGGS